MPLLLKRVDAGRGASWMRDAIRLYARRPLAFTMLFVVFLFAALAISLLPLVGGVLQMMTLPLLSLGFMIASQSALLDGPIRASQFIEPLRANPGQRRALLTLCVLYGVSAVGILLLCDAMSGGAIERVQLLMAGGGSPFEMADLLGETRVSLALLTGAVLGTTLSIAFWHAPALVHWGAQSVAQSLFSSTLAVWRSKGAFFVYGLAWIGMFTIFVVLSALLFDLLGMRQLAPLVSLPAGLMFSTVFYVSLLFTFNDSFGGVQPA